MKNTKKVSVNLNKNIQFKLNPNIWIKSKMEIVPVINAKMIKAQKDYRLILKNHLIHPPSFQATGKTKGV